MNIVQDPQCDACGSPLPAGKDSGLCRACLWAGDSNDGDATNNTRSEGQELLVELSALLPDFEWLDVIGQGGMGTVYKARQKRLDRLVAVKVLSEEISIDKLFASRFEREAKILARLNHPHIVTIHDFGQELDVYFLVMEHVEGANLAQVLQRGPLQIGRALRVARQLCSALLCAHERGILHRDIKPANILLDSEGMVKIADFGLAKLGGATEAVDTFTMPGTTMGTPRYMAPEQWEAPERVDHRADIFAFGMIFYQMLTAKVPSGMIQLPSKTTDVDSLADHIVRRCLAPEVTDRYEDASALESDLLALDRTSGAQIRLRAEDSWLRPPPAQLPANGAPEEATVIDTAKAAEPVAVSLPAAQSRRRLPIQWLVAATLLVCSMGGWALWKKQESVPKSDHAASQRLVTLPALVGAQWWFDDMPYLIPPVRWQLAQAGAGRPIEQVTSASAVSELRTQLRAQTLELSQTTTDAALAEVLHDLLKRRSVALHEVEAKVAPLAVIDSPMWQHTHGVLLQRRGQYAEAIGQYRAAIRCYKKDNTSKSRLASLCMADLAKCYSVSGQHDEAVVAYDRALSSVLPSAAPFFHVVCLADKSSSCRRIQAWEEAEQCLQGADRLLALIGASADHPLITYIHQRFGWLYMDAWKLEQARSAFQKSITSRAQQLANDDGLALRIQQSHDEMAFAMCQRYAGQDVEALTSYESVRQFLVTLQERVNRSPDALRDWLSRYHNVSERMGDCYLFGPEDSQSLAVSHFHQSLLDLRRAMNELEAENAKGFLPQLARYLGKSALALALQGKSQGTFDATQGELANLALSGSHQTSTKLFSQVATLLWVAKRAPQRSGEHVAALQALVEANKQSLFSRDEREVFLLAARELAMLVDREGAESLSQVITMLLLKEPIDRSVLPFLRPHFNRLVSLRLNVVGGADWGIVRDMQFAKTGLRLTDLPKGPALIIYFQADRERCHLVRVLPDATCTLQTVPITDPKELWQHESMNTWLEGVVDVYWTDLSLPRPLTLDMAVGVPASVRVH